MLDDKLKIPLGRPTLTVLFDRFSKCIVGLSLNFREPSYDSVRKAILNTLLNKDSIKNAYPSIKNDWPCHGKIGTLIVDNGAEFWSSSLEDSLKAFVTDIQYCQAGKPWRKAGVEKFFDIFNKKLINKLKGKTFVSTVQLKGYDPKKEAAVTVSTFLELMYKWIVDYYHMNSDSKDRHIPYHTWKDSPLHPMIYSSTEELLLRIELGILREDCVVGIDGIRLHNIRYQSEALNNFRKYTAANTNKNPKVKTKTDPSDISAIYVWLPSEKKYIKVPAVNEKIRKSKISLFQLQVIKRVHRLNVRRKIDEEAIAETFLYLEGKIRDEYGENENANKKPAPKTGNTKKPAQFLDLGSDGPSSIVERNDHVDEQQNKKHSNTEPNEINFDDDEDFSQIGGYKNANE